MPPVNYKIILTTCVLFMEPRDRDTVCATKVPHRRVAAGLPNLKHGLIVAQSGGLPPMDKGLPKLHHRDGNGTEGRAHRDDFRLRNGVINA